MRYFKVNTQRQPTITAFVGAETNFQVPLEVRAFISSSIAYFQAGINKASIYDLGIDSEDKERANWRKVGFRLS